LFFLVNVSADDCLSLAADLKLPLKLKTRGKPKVARWEQVDELLNGIRQSLQGNSCGFTYANLFQTKERDLYFPLTNTVLRVGGEETFVGLMVYHKDGTALGEFAQRVPYERTGGLYATQSYTLYYFQFTDSSGKLQSVGHRLLLDDFALRFEDIKDRVAFSGK
jgi:hypothetical protein